MAELHLDEVIDPHIHLFDVAGTPRPTQPLVKMFGWNDKALRMAAKVLFPKHTMDFFGEDNSLMSDYLPPHYRADTTSSRVGRYVHIQAGWKDKTPMDAVGETQWLESLDDPPAGIVAYADLRLGANVAPILKAHKAASVRVKGIRHMMAMHANPVVMPFAEDPDMSLTREFRKGFEQLAEHELSYDAWAFSTQLGQVAALAKDVPEVPVVLCHAGTPAGYGGDFQGIGASKTARDQIAAQWRNGIQLVAAQPHVRVKLSGLLMPVLGFGYEHKATKPGVSELVDKLGPLVRFCIDAFGPERCMVASNFPVDRVSASYSNVFDAMVELTEQDGQVAQAQMFAGTAESFYQL